MGLPAVPGVGVTARVLFPALLVFVSSGAVAQTKLLVVTGIGGDPQYSEMFHEWAVTLIDAATDRNNVAADNVFYLGERLERDPGRIRARSTKEEVVKTFQVLARDAGPSDLVFVVLIGHGSTRNDESRFNLPGPDLTAAEFDQLLDAFETQRIVFVNTSTASGGFVTALAAPNRTIVTATKTGFERNESVFGGFFVRAYAEDVADVDKDGRVSVLEAFTYAVQEVRRSYESDNRLLTEHALLEDNADGEGSGEPSVDGPDGSLAATMFLQPSGPVTVAGIGDSVLTVLYREKEAIEQQIAALRARRSEMDQNAYELQLEDLLVELTLKNRAIREREQGGGA